MKKLYFLNEEEKERILKLHESATTKQYISEADTGSVLGGAAAGAAIGSAFPVVGTIAGAVIGGALGLIRGSGGSYSGVEKIFQACNASGMGKTTMDGGTLDSISKQVHDAIEGWGTDEDAIKSALGKIATIPDLCAVNKRYAENYPGYTLLGDLDGDIDSDSEWNEYVYQPLLAAKRKSEELGAGKSSGGSSWMKDTVKTQMVSILLKSQPSWANYMCIVNNKDAKIGKMSNGSYAITIGNSVYYDNGRYKAPDGTMKSYTCPGTTVTTTKSVTPTKTKTVSKSTGTNALSQSNVKQVQKMVGVAETGVFDTATAKAVRAKLGA